MVYYNDRRHTKHKHSNVVRQRYTNYTKSILLSVIEYDLASLDPVNFISNLIQGSE